MSSRSASVAISLTAFSAGVVLGWLLFSSGADPVRDSPWHDDGHYGPCEVAHIVDGDTIDVACGGIPSRVRLLNVDTPERGEAGHEQARDALEHLIGGREVSLLFEAPGQPTLGKFGRLLAYVVSENGSNLNLELIRGGWSLFYRKYGDGRFPESFAQAETDARNRRTGLWAMR